MKRTFLMIAMLIAVSLFCNCNSSHSNGNPDLEGIKAGIIEYENNNLPLFLQDHNTIHSIVIDSVVITSDVEPYRGYIATTWDIDEKQDLNANQWYNNGMKDKYIRKTRPVLIELTNIQIENDGSFSWFANWEEAFSQVQDNRRS